MDHFAAARSAPTISGADVFTPKPQLEYGPPRPGTTRTNRPLTKAKKAPPGPGLWAEPRPGGAGRRAKETSAGTGATWGCAPDLVTCPLGQRHKARRAGEKCRANSSGTSTTCRLGWSGSRHGSALNAPWLMRSPLGHGWGQTRRTKPGAAISSAGRSSAAGSPS
jgi:hypothetical protein